MNKKGPKKGPRGTKSKKRTWEKGTGFFEGQKFRKNPDDTVDIIKKGNGKEIREQRKYPQNIYRVIDKKTGKVTETFTDAEKYIWVDKETTVGELERKGASLQPSLAKKVKKKGGGYIKKYAKGSIVRKVRV